MLNDFDLLPYSEYFRNFETKDQAIMDINFDNPENMEELKNLSNTLRIVVTHKPLSRNENYLTWEHWDINQWLRKFEIVKGEINSQRYAKYDRGGKLISCFSLN